MTGQQKKAKEKKELKQEFKELLNRLESFYDEKVEGRVKKGIKEIEEVGKKDVKDVLDELEKFFDDKVEPKFKKGWHEVEKLLKKEIKIKGIDGAKLLEYDPESPFSYVSAFLRDRAVAAVHPSSKYVVRRVLKAMALERVKVVVEFGPAEGVMTRQILQAVGPDATVIAIELNENFVSALHRIKDKRLRVVHGDVQDVDRIVRDNGFEAVDRVVSGIPFSFFDTAGRHRLLGKIKDLLDPKGRFVAYQFTTHLIPLLKQYFSRVEHELELRNLPPHFVFTSYK
jgi:phospholipid N-methyltransferase